MSEQLGEHHHGHLCPLIVLDPLFRDQKHCKMTSVHENLEERRGRSFQRDSTASLWPLSLLCRVVFIVTVGSSALHLVS